MSKHNKSHTSKPLPRRFAPLWDILAYIGLGATILIIAIATMAILPRSTVPAAKAAQPPAQAPQLGMSSASRGAAASTSLVYKPATTNQATSLTSSDVGTSSDGFDPPVAGQGGTCISGQIIDIYEQPRGGAGWDVTIQKTLPTKESPQTKTADANGHFQFHDLSAGTYEVVLKEPEGWRPFTPDKFEVTLNGTSSECAQVRFKKEALANLEVTKLDDGGNADLKQKIGIPGWKITITDSSGNSQTQETDGSGKAYFRNLAPGVWTVTDEARVGWQFVLSFPPAPGPSIVITLASPQHPGTFQSVIFVNKQVNPYFIRVVKQDNHQQPLSGWHMTLTRNDGTQPPQHGATANGILYFIDLTAGDWTVTEAVPGPGWRAVNPVSKMVTLTPDHPGQEVIFVNEPLGCVDGYKINHLGQGLPGWQITAHNASTGAIATTTTNATGYFQFYLSLGTWTISEVVQAGWSAVTSPDFSVEVTRLFECEHVRFKNRTDFACVDVYKKDDYDNVGLPGWLITLKPAYGGTPLSGLTDGTGWVRFNQLAPGEYDISVLPQPGWVPIGPTSIRIKLDATGTCPVVTFYNRQTNNPIPRDLPDPPASSPTPRGDSACVAYYTVRSGDTLYRIAVNHGVAWQDLQEVNHLTDPRLIHPNTVLCIP